MNDAQKILLAAKKRNLALKLKAKEVIHHFIEFHWLRYFGELLQLGMKARIIHLHSANQEELSYYRDAIADLQHPSLDPEMIRVDTISPMDEFFDAFPSLSHFKYVVDLPIIAQYGGDPGEMLRIACDQLNIQDGPVLFMSNDVSPVIELQLSELISNATRLFDDGGLITLIFTDPDKKWVIFRSIEEEWRCGHWPT